MRWTIRVLAFLFMAVSLMLFYLSYAGLPQGLVEKWLGEFAARGWYLDIRQVRLDLLKGIVAEQVRFFESPEKSMEPLMEADVMLFRVRPTDWLQHKSGLTGFGLREGRIRLDVDTSSTAPSILSVDHINSLVLWEPDGLRVQRLNAECLGLKLRCQGWVATGKPTGKPAAQQRQPLKVVIQEFLASQQSWLPKALDNVQLTEFKIPPRVDVSFSVDPQNPSTNEISVHVEGYGTRYKKVEIDGWTFAGRQNGSQLKVDSATIQRESGKFEASGLLDFKTRQLEARAFCSISPDYWTPLLPVNILRSYNTQNPSFDGIIKCEVWLGPTTLDKVLDQLSGWVSVEKASVAGVWVEKGFLAFKKEGDAVSVNKMDTTLGTGSQQGPVKGDFTVQLDSMTYAGHLQIGCDPHAVASILTSNQANIVQWFELNGGQPHADLEFSGSTTNASDFRLTARVQATNAYFRGAYVPAFDGVVSWPAPGTLVFDPMFVTRNEGKAEGKLKLDFGRQLAEFDIVSSANPYAVAKAIGETSSKFLQNFRLEGPVDVVARGIVDYGSNVLTDVTADVKAQRLGMKVFMLDEAAFRLTAKGWRIEVTNIVGSMHGGAVSGHAAFYPVGSITNYRYEVDAALQGLNLASLKKDLGKAEPEPQPGKMTTSFHVEGFIGEGRGGTATGNGLIRIYEAQLLKVRLFGGLSKMLSRIYPQFGFATQTDFASTFVIRNRKVHTDDAQLIGSLFSLRGRGDYYFNEKLDFEIQFQLLSSGPIADLLRLATFPVTKLLEFQLEGTVDDPRWRPVNLPKSLFQSSE